MTDITSPPDVAGTTSTAGTGSWTITGTLPTPAGGTYRPWSSVPTGSRVHCIREDDGGVNFERGYADVVVTGGIAVMSWFSRVETSAGGAAPVSWAGTQNVLVLSGSVHGPNAGSEFAPYAAAFRANIGLAIGSSVGQLVAWVAGPKYPAGDGSLLTNLPAGTPSVPSGARIPFYMAAVPSGYTLVTGMNDMLISVTDGSGANPAGGTTGNIGGWDNSWGIAVANHSLTVAEMPSHSHDVSTFAVNLSSGVVVVSIPTSGPGGTLAPGSANPTGGGGGHSHTLSSTSQWRPPNARFLIGQKV